MTDDRSPPDSPPVRLVHVTTVPFTLRFFHGQIGYLQSRGFDVHAVSSPGEPLDHFGEVERIPVHGVPMTRSITPLRDLLAVSRLRRLLLRLRPDIVHAHTPKAALLAALASRLARVPVVVVSIFGLAQMTKRGPARLLLDAVTRLTCRLADRVWCDSRSVRDHLVQTGLSRPEKAVVFGDGSVNGVDAAGSFAPDRHLPDRRRIRDEHRIPADAPVIGFVGRIVPDKGIRELVEAWELLREQDPATHMLVVGPFETVHPLPPDIRSRLCEDPRVHLAGFRDDVAAQIAAMDVFVNPSYREGFGIANIEASAMGLPVVATRIPGCIDSVRDGVTGTLVPVRNAAALAAAVRAYLESPDLRREHGSAGRERALHDFRPERIWQELEQEYRRLLARPAARHSRTPGLWWRSAEVAAAGLLLLAMAPVMLIVAALIRLTLGSPVVFRQRRAGLQGRPFVLYKFRTMSDRRDVSGRLRPDAERLTHLGLWLRKTSLDELPQLWNVLRGEMSFIGPRPLPVEYLERYTPEQARRHDIKPGLTGWAQVHGRNAVDWDTRLTHDIWYVRHRTARLDLLILWKTIGVLLSGKGASPLGCPTMPEFRGRQPETSDRRPSHEVGGRA